MDKNKVKPADNGNGKTEGKNLNPFIVLIAVIVLCTILSYFMAPGAYDRVDLNGRSVVVADSYHQVDRTPVAFFDMFRSIPYGLEGAASMMFLVMLIGGVVEIYNKTGAIDQGMIKISNISNKVGGEVVLAVIMVIFCLIGGILGWSEQIIPFVPIIISLCLALGYDSLVGMAISGFACLISFAVAPFNIYTVAIAHQVAELPMFSGMELRLVVLLCFIVVSTAYVVCYARKIRKNPELSLMKDIDVSSLRRDFSAYASQKITGIQITSLIILGCSFIVSIYGLLKKGWGVQEMGALFLLGGIVVALLGRMKKDEITDTLIAGARAAFPGALIIGVARSIQWVLTTGGLIDPIIHGLSSMLGGVSAYLTIVGIFILNTVINAFIPSGSGQAMAVMPVLVPLADMLHITRQTAILAFQFGDGISNTFWFTNGTLLIYLGLAKVPLRKWYKFIIPLQVVFFIMACLFLFVAYKTGYGPF